jgi:hypothetical protein
LSDVSQVDDVVPGKFQDLQFRVELGSGLVVRHILWQLVQVNGGVLVVKWLKELFENLNVEVLVGFKSCPTIITFG